MNGWRRASAGPAGGPRRRGWGRLLCLELAAALALQAGGAAPALAGGGGEPLLEDLSFRVDYLLWKEVARVRLTLTRLGPGRYRAELSGEPEGVFKIFIGPRRDSCETEMIWRDGKFVPLVYREECRKKKARYLKEYRFDYRKGRLELWQLKEKQGVLVLKWHTALKGEIGDPLSAFYNYRLGLLGPLKEGATYKIQGIPYPKPEAIELRIGPETPRGRKVMVYVSDLGFGKKPGTVFAYLNRARVPTQAWSSFMRLGTIRGELLPGGKPLKAALPEVSGEARRRAGSGITDWGFDSF